MPITGIITQLRTTDLAASIAFYTQKLGLELKFRYQDFYAGIGSGEQLFHLKLSDRKDPSIDLVREEDHFHLYLTTPDARALAAEVKGRGVPLVREVHETPWRTREFIIRDDQGHTLYFGEAL